MGTMQQDELENNKFSARLEDLLRLEFHISTWIGQFVENLPEQQPHEQLESK